MAEHNLSTRHILHVEAPSIWWKREAKKICQSPAEGMHMNDSAWLPITIVLISADEGVNSAGPYMIDQAQAQAYRKLSLSLNQIYTGSWVFFLNVDFLAVWAWRIYRALAANNFADLVGCCCCFDQFLVDVGDQEENLGRIWKWQETCIGMREPLDRTIDRECIGTILSL